ncbi:MAG: TetR/AcrR family transcriptional regulator [Myxococcota bacterium]
MAAIHRATIQVLNREGLARCTTTRVAERAGVSVGSVYQYYSGRDVLLVAVLDGHLQRVSAEIEVCCARLTPEDTLETVAQTLVGAIVGAKLKNPAEARSLYVVAREYQSQQVIDRASKRVVHAFATALDRLGFGLDALEVSTTLIRAIGGVLEGLLTRGARANDIATAEMHLCSLSAGYLKERLSSARRRT